MLLTGRKVGRGRRFLWAHWHCRREYCRGRNGYHPSSRILRLTERPLDIALQEPGFFVVQTPQGEAYTRDGHLQLSADGTLVNSQGFPVLGENGTIILGMGYPEIDSSGNIYQDNVFIDRIRVVNFAGDAPLWKDGYNLFRTEEDVVPQVVESYTLFQGALEESNADMTRQMTDLIKVRRCYEAAQKISQVYDRMLSRAANDLGACTEINTGGRRDAGNRSASAIQDPGSPAVVGYNRS